MDHCVDCASWDRRSPWTGKCSEWATTKDGPPFIIASKARSGYSMGENIQTLEQFGCPAWKERTGPFTVSGDVLIYNRGGKPVAPFDLWPGDPDELPRVLCTWLNRLWPEDG